MKKILKRMALFMAFIMLMTSCYSTRVSSSDNNQDEIKVFISKLETGDRIRIKTMDSGIVPIEFRELNHDIIKGIDLRLKGRNNDNQLSEIIFIDIWSITEIKTYDPDKTRVSVFVGLIVLFVIMAAKSALKDKGSSGWWGGMSTSI